MTKRWALASEVEGEGTMFSGVGRQCCPGDSDCSAGELSYGGSICGRVSVYV